MTRTPTPKKCYSEFSQKKLSVVLVLLTQIHATGVQCEKIRWTLSFLTFFSQMEEMFSLLIKIIFKLPCNSILIQITRHRDKKSLEALKYCFYVY